MRVLILAAMLIFLVSHADAADYQYRDVSGIPCAGYVALNGSSLSTILSYPVVEYIEAHAKPRGAALGSNCNISDYVLAICRARPKQSIGSAVSDLLKRQATGSRLPVIPRCGA